MEEESKNNTVNIVKEEQDDDAKWVTHYCSDHQILLVGEGDFSFSLSLAKSFGSASNIFASSLNSYDDVIKMYKNAKSNLDDLHKLEACLLHGVDATKMKLHSDLKMRRFDRVVFNFPHSGFHRREDDTLLIEMHKTLVLGFFKNASCMLRPNGEIHVSHKTTAPFTNWNIEKLATQCCLTLIECADFKREDYPGYNNKRGDGNRCDEPFPLGKCCTYKFIYKRKAKQQNRMNRKQMVVSRQQRHYSLQQIESVVEQLPISDHVNYYPQTSHFPKMEEAVPSVFGLTNGRTSIIGGHLSNMAEVHRIGVPYGGYSAHGMSQGSSRPMEPLQSLQPWQPTSTYFGGGRLNYLQEQLGRTVETVPLSLGARNEGYHYGGRLNYLQEEHGRTTAHRASCYSFDKGHNLRNTLLKCPTSTNVGYSLRDHVRPIDPVSLSLGARNEGYHHHVNGGCSNYLQEELGRTAAQKSFDGVRSDFERYIGLMCLGKSLRVSFTE